MSGRAKRVRRTLRKARRDIVTAELVKLSAAPWKQRLYVAWHILLGRRA
jgi:hypothetical protein